jgi:hypothetical protein
MTLRVRREPILPTVPAEADFKDFDRLERWWKAILKIFRDHMTNVYDDMKDLKYYEGLATWDPGSIADGDMEAKDVTVTGATLGDFAIASFSLDIKDLVLDAQVTVANVATCVLSNNTGSAVDLASGIVKVRVLK